MKFEIMLCRRKELYTRAYQTTRVKAMLENLHKNYVPAKTCEGVFWLNQFFCYGIFCPIYLNYT
ncbi:hypothetical protein T06_7758 [Trichinella sp. T6]|nr:hypothetical protein T06_7758 [Trichinella sp. T6]